MNPMTHTAIDRALCGEPQELREGYARVRLELSPEMRADERDLAHGGFVFGMADYAAMLAVNHPNVVLGSVRMRFLKPVRVGELLEAEATLHDQEGSKKIVTVDVHRGDATVASAEMICFTPERHVLESKG